MVFDKLSKLFKRKTVDDEAGNVNEEISQIDNEQTFDTEAFNTSQTLYEKPDLDFLNDEQPLDDILKEFGLSASDIPSDEMDNEGYIQNMLDSANDILGNNADLDSIMSGDDTDSMELEALKASLTVPDASKPSSAMPPSTLPSTSLPSTAMPPFMNVDSTDDEALDPLSEFDKLFGGTDSENLDSLINSALEQDRIEESLSTFDESDRDFINDTTVFQEIDPFPTVRYEKPKSKIQVAIEGASAKQLRLIMIILSALIAIVIAATLLIALLNTQSRMLADQSGASVISQAKAPVNNANYIYVNTGLKFRDDVLVLTKILVDTQCTAFYFSKKIDTGSLVISLTDDQGNSYAPDLSFARLSDMTSELRFQPLEDNVSVFYLYIKDSETGEEIVYEYSLRSMIMLPEARYVGKTKDLLSGRPDLNAYIENMTFTSAGSYLNYSLKWTDDFQLLRLGRKSGAQIIALTEDGKSVSPVGKAQEEYFFEDDNIVLGRMEFAPLKSLDANITVRFTDLYRMYNLNTTIQAGSLFRYRSEPVTELGLYDHKIVFERAGWQGDKLILVCHAESENLYAVSGAGQDNDNRIEVVLDISAVINTPDGKIVLDGVCRSSALGTDVIFEAGDKYSKARTAGADNCVFIISRAYIKNEDISVSYTLDKRYSMPDSENNYAKIAIEAAFESRLAFKSGEADIYGVKGFSEELMQLDKLMEEYAPVSDVSAVYAAQVLTISVEGDAASAVVAEYWHGNIDGNLETIMRRYKIKAVASPVGWVIISEELE